MRFAMTLGERADLLVNLARMRREAGDEAGALLAEERADLVRWQMEHPRLG